MLALSKHCSKISSGARQSFYPGKKKVKKKKGAAGDNPSEINVQKQRAKCSSGSLILLRRDSKSTWFGSDI